MNQKKPTIMENLAFLSVKQGIYLAELYEALVAAREKGKIKCQNLLVEYRCSIKDKAIFLITKDSKIVLQFRVEEELLQKKDICFEHWMDTDKIRKQMNRQSFSPKSTVLVQDLRHGMKKVNLEAKVLEIPSPLTVQTRYGNSAKVTNAWIEDETGKVKLCLWNEQTELFSVGDTLQIKNASVSTFKGERQLRLGKNGTAIVLQNSVAEMEQEKAVAKNRIYA